MVTVQAATRPPVTSWRQILGICNTALLWVPLLLFVSVGFLAGLAWWAIRWAGAAVAVGFHAGNDS